MTVPDMSRCCNGYCAACGTRHHLPSASARPRAALLFRALQQRANIDIFSGSRPDPALSTDRLFGEAGGKMFGILECADRNGHVTWLPAFSGQYNGHWQVTGWAPPLFDIEAFAALNTPGERRIKALGRRIDRLPPDHEGRLLLQRRRKGLSRELMRRIHGLYRLTNSRGQIATLAEACLVAGAKPTGTGDCCGPKLLNYAAERGLRPLSLAEFYFGRRNRSGTRKHGRFYPPCPDKCQPLLGFLLCGSEHALQRP